MSRSIRRKRNSHKTHVMKNAHMRGSVAITLGALIAVPAAWAIPGITLGVSDTDIIVGETFTVDVFAPGYLDETSSGGELYNGLLAFGLDSSWGSLLSYGGAIVPVFDDDSALTDHGVLGHVSGSTFPANDSPSILLAQLTFTAVGAGSDSVSISGLADGIHGLYYESCQNIGIDASLPIPISPSGPHVPDSANLLLTTAITLFGLCELARRRRQAESL